MANFIEVLSTIPFNEAQVKVLESVSPRLRVTVHKALRPDEVPAEVWERVEVLYTSRALPAVEQAGRLRWIQFHWAGIDHALDAPILYQQGLQVSNLSGVAVTQLAEYVVMMMLALGHRLPDLAVSQRKAEWPADRWERFRPCELRGSTVGIVGYGSIGREVARLLNALGATVLATKRDAKHPESRRYTPEGLGDPTGDLARRIYPPQAIASMFKLCDFVLVSVPLTAETRHLIGTRELAALKPGAFIVDISRGHVIDPAALIAALREQKLGGAALDVFPQEPLPPDNPLWKMPNVILTPHIAGNTAHYDELAAAFFAENLHRYLAGLPLYNLVDVGRGY